MSTGTICDGCGKVNATLKRGLVIPYDYCEKCAKVVDEYQKKCDDLHNKIAAQWNDGLAKITSEFSKSHPDMRFPDG